MAEATDSAFLLSKAGDDVRKTGHAFFVVGALIVAGFLSSALSCERMEYQQQISAGFPYESQYVEVLGSRMHYVEAGSGRPILLIHGNPTSSYLWRNIIPHLESRGRVIAVDLIGMGRSDKPDIEYTFQDHARYLDGFIAALDLRQIVLVIHDWGSALGFRYAVRHQQNVRGIAFMEAITRPFTWDDFDWFSEFMFKRIRDPETGPEMILEDNVFIERVLPGAVLRDLSAEEMNRYREPFLTPESRRPILVWPSQIPIEGDPAGMHALVSGYRTVMQTWEVPKLLLYAEPGLIVQGEEAAREIAAEYSNCSTIYIGNGKHFIQEDQPDNIGRALSDWISQLP
ncbi:MAG: haloalkane dehalogenase [Leptospiraceae bacterium]|nr:haloalkane dehalogenase [Leptospiraceae bacterium]